MKNKSATITKEECEIIIKNKFKNERVTVIDYKLMNLAEKSGFLGEHLQLEVNVINEQNETKIVHCFAKFMPTTEVQYDFVATTGAFKKEKFVYDKLFPEICQHENNYLQSCIPECYYSKQDYVIVIEDITKLGYKPLNKYNELDLPHVLVSLKAMAKLHASSLIFEEKHSKNLFEMHEEYLFETFYVNAVEHKGGQGVRAALKGLQKQVDLFFDARDTETNDNFKKWLETSTMILFTAVRPSKKFRNVICHGDLWTTNIMIKYSGYTPEDCKLFDFQTIRYCPPAHDFMSFIFLTTSRHFRSEHLENLQRFYYNELNTLLKNANYDLNRFIPFSEFIDSCQEQKLFAAFLTANYKQMTHIKDDFIYDFIKEEDKWHDAIYKDRSFLINDLCKKDPDYASKLEETIKDLRDIFETSHNK